VSVILSASCTDSMYGPVLCCTILHVKHCFSLNDGDSVKRDRQQSELNVTLFVAKLML